MFFLQKLAFYSLKVSCHQANYLLIKFVLFLSPLIVSQMRIRFFDYRSINRRSSLISTIIAIPSVIFIKNFQDLKFKIQNLKFSFLYLYLFLFIYLNYSLFSFSYYLLLSVNGYLIFYQIFSIVIFISLASHIVLLSFITHHFW